MDSDHARRLALSFPEAVEKETWDHPTFRVRDKMFMAMAGDGTSATVKATREAQAALVGSRAGDVLDPGLRGPARVGRRRRWSASTTRSSPSWSRRRGG